MSDTSSTSAPSPVANITAQARALWSKLPARARTGALVSLIAIAGLVGYLMMQGGGGGWQSVTEGLTPTDARQLIGSLNNRGIRHRLRGTTVVEVPSARLEDARMEAVLLGVPRSTAGLESIDKLSRMATSHQEKVWFQSALQGQLTHAIETLGPIERAVINLAFGKSSVFKNGGDPTTASVTVYLRPGAELSRSQVSGIKQIVANGVTGLSVEHVSVTDQNANPLSELSADKTDQQTTMGVRLADEVRRMLETVTGPGKVKVVAQVELDRRTINKTEESFKDPVILSQLLVTTPGAAPAPTNSGLAGVQGNLPGSTTTTTTPAAGGGDVVTSTTNNQVGRTVVQTEDPAIRISRISLVVLLAEGVDEDGEPAPRTPEEIAKVTAIAHTAAGLDDARGDKLTVEAMAFAPIEVAVIAPVAKSKLPVPMPVAIGGGVALLLVAAVLLGGRKRPPVDDATSRIALPAPVAELERALSAAALGESSSAPAQLPGRTLEERVLGAVRGDVQRTSRVLASWLAEPDPVPTNPHSKARA